jgi:ABC-type dipeptide/oligopeptide/nickel transport system permease subunit
MIICALFLGMALYAEIYGAYCSLKGVEPVYQRQDAKACQQAPSAKHWMGTDYLGRDVFLRALFASKTAVKVGVIASLIASVVGVGLGLLAGYFGGKTDDFVVWLYSVFASMPTLLFILAFALLVSKGFIFPPLAKAFAALAFLLRAEPGMLAVYLGIGLTGWVSLCKVVRGEALRLRETQYVQASKVLGQRSLKSSCATCCRT